MVQASSTSCISYQRIDGPDGEPLSILEIARLKAMFKPIIDEFDAYYESMTDEEKKFQKRFNKERSNIAEEAEKYQEYMDQCFASCNVKNNGKLDKEEFKTYVEQMDEYVVKYGMKSHETTDELIDMYWKCFTKYNSANENGIIF